MEGGGNLAFFIGETMIFWTQIFLAFAAGIVLNKVWTSFIGVGYAIIMLKNTQKACLQIMKETLEQTEAAMEMKYGFLEKAEAGEKRTNFERKFDEQMLGGFKRNIVRSLNNSVPRSLGTTVQHKNWEEAMTFLQESE